MSKWIKKFWNDEQGLELSEYAIMIALVIVIAVATIYAVGQSINAKFSALDDAINYSGSSGAGT